MKKLLSMFLLLSLVLSLCSCGNNQTSIAPEASTNSHATSEKENEPSSDTKQPTTEATTEPTEDSTKETSKNHSQKLDFQKTANISETVLYDENDVRITATTLTYESWKAEISLLIENNSSKDLSFLSGTMGYSCNSINGMMIPDGYLNCDVTAGKKTNDTISFQYDTLMLYGITEIAEVELAFDIRDENYNDIYTGPCQLKTTKATQFTYDANTFRNTIQSVEAQSALNYTVDFFAEDILYEQNDIRLLSQTIIYNSANEPQLLLEFFNDSEDIVNIGVANIGLNGITLSNGLWDSDTIAPNKACIFDISLNSITDETFIEALGISTISKVDFEVRLDDQNYDKLAEAQQVEITIDSRNDSFNKGDNELVASTNVRITSLGIVDDESEYSGAKYALLVVENVSSIEIEVEVEYGTVSVNDFMINSWNPAITIKSGSYGLLEIEISESDIKNYKIDAISKLEAEISITDGHYNTIEEHTIGVTY